MQTKTGGPKEKASYISRSFCGTERGLYAYPPIGVEEQTVLNETRNKTIHMTNFSTEKYKQSEDKRGVHGLPKSTAQTLTYACKIPQGGECTLSNVFLIPGIIIRVTLPGKNVQYCFLLS